MDKKTKIFFIILNIVIAAIVIGITSYAAYVVNSTDVSYTPTTGSQTSVKAALDDLYSKSQNRFVSVDLLSIHPSCTVTSTNSSSWGSVVNTSRNITVSNRTLYKSNFFSNVKPTEEVTIKFSGNYSKASFNYCSSLTGSSYRTSGVAWVGGVRLKCPKANTFVVVTENNAGYAYFNFNIDDWESVYLLNQSSAESARLY